MVTVEDLSFKENVDEICSNLWRLGIFVVQYELVFGSLTSGRMW